MKKTLATILSLCLILSCTTFVAMAADYTSLIEECLTTEVSSAITKNLTLPATWDGAAITWESSDDAVISNSGVVTRGASDKTVTLTAKADGAAVKTLTFTVIGKGKKVWASENFYRPDSVGEELATNATVLTNTADQFVESVEGAVGHAGFRNIESSAYDTNKISIEENPDKTGDYAMRMYINHPAAETGSSSKGGFALPSLDSSELPAGKVTVEMTITTTISDKYDEWRIGASDQLDKNNTLISFAYNKKATLGSAANATDGANIATLTAVDGKVSTRMKLEIDYAAGTYSVVDVTNGTATKSEFAFPANTGSVLKQLNFTNRQAVGDTYESTLYIDDIVITTDEIDGATDDERAENYKALLANDLADIKIADEDFSLDLLPAFNADYSVAWESSDENLVAIDNANKVADVKFTEIPRNVTLTGTITHGDATATITKEICVAAPDVTIKSETAEGVTGIVDYEGYVGDYNAVNNPLPYRHGQITANDNAVLKGVEAVNGNNYLHFEDCNIRYGRISSEATIKGCGYKVLSADFMYEKPANGTKVLPSVVLALGQGTNALQLSFLYTVSEDGVVAKRMYAVVAGEEVIYVSEALVPDVDEWFNLKIVTYNNNSVCDVYINNERVFEKSLPYLAAAANTAFHNVSFNTICTGYESAAANIDNIALYGAATATPWTAAASDLTLVSIDGIDDILEGADVTWTATGDVGINGTSLTKSKTYGLGKGVVTASAVATDGTAVTRSHNIWYGTGINKVNANETTLETISYTTDCAAKGFVGLYNASKELLDVKIFNMTSGNGNLAAFNEALPAGFDSYKVFVWDGATLKPLADPFED